MLKKDKKDKKEEKEDKKDKKDKKDDKKDKKDGESLFRCIYFQFTDPGISKDLDA